jgi:hypothetical protein
LLLHHANEPRIIAYAEDQLGFDRVVMNTSMDNERATR